MDTRQVLSVRNSNKVRLHWHLLRVCGSMERQCSGCLLAHDGVNCTGKAFLSPEAGWMGRISWARLMDGLSEVDL